MLHIVSSIVVLVIATGLYFRHRPSLHIKLMSSAFVLDLALVLYIEFSRHAVEKVSHSVRPIIWFHALISLGVLACYIAMILLGRRVLGGKVASKRTHRNLGIAFVLLRATNYATALML